MASNKIYQCDCGCNLFFEDYSLGVEYQILNYIDENGYGRLISENKIIDNSWEDYMYGFNTVGDFIQLIKENKEVDNIRKHLYNKYICFENIPPNKQLSYEYCF